ncbi:histidine kinase, partial [Streptomyces sp. LMG1-1-1.1]
ARAVTSAAGRVGAGAARGQVGTSGPRAALPARDGAPQGAPQSRTPQPQNAQLDQTGQLPQNPDALRPGPGGGLIGGAASAIPSRTDVWGNQGGQGNQGPGQSGQHAGPGAPQHAPQGQAPQGNQPGGYDFPRAELPGGNPQAQRPQAASWGNDPAQQPVRRPQQEMSPLDAPRGHEDPEAAGLFGGPAAPQGPGSTGQFPRPDFGAPQQAPQAQQPQVPQAYQGGVQDPASTAQFPRPDFGAPQGPGSTGQFPRPDYDAPQGPGSTGQFPRPDFGAPQAPQQGRPQQAPQPQAPQAYQGGQQQQFGRQPYVPQAQQQAQAPQAPAPRQRNGGDFGAPRPAAEPGQQPQQPALQQPRRPEALPPAGTGDGRTPLYDTLETNWFHQDQAQQQAQQQADAAQTTQTPVVPQPSAPAPADGGRQNGGAAWRTSPNDELVRQAERVRKPAAGGVTTSGLPRRVPKANLVPGTAQEQAHTAGPQVSRAPDDVRGRLTNLRRGIQQGRQANNSTTGSFDLGPNHQQER